MSVTRPDFKYLKLTEEQRRADREFAESLRTRYVEPIIEEMEASHRGYRDMGDVEKFNLLACLNEKVIGKGECLPVICPEYENAWFQAYSGVPVSVDYLASGGTKGGILPQQPAEIYSMPGIRGAMHVLSFEDFHELPPAFRIAVIAEHVLENVVTGNTEAFSFALSGGELKSYRVVVAPKATFPPGSAFRRVDGWVIHVRDAMPSNEMLVATAQFIRAYDERVAEAEAELRENGHDADLINRKSDHRKRRRSGSLAVREMVELVDAAIAKGMDPRRGGTCSWSELWFDLSDSHPAVTERYSTPEKLMQSYSQYKRRSR